MSRDILENMLREKLSEMSVNPPAGLWEKLESGIAAAGAIGAGVGAAVMAEGATSVSATMAGGAQAAVGASQGGLASAGAAATTTTTATAAGGSGLGGAAIGGIAVGVAATAAIVGIVIYDGETDTVTVDPTPIVETIEDPIETPFEEVLMEVEPDVYMAVGLPVETSEEYEYIHDFSMAAISGVPEEEDDSIVEQDSEPKVVTVEFVPPVISLDKPKMPISVSLFASTAGASFGGDVQRGVIDYNKFTVREILEGPGGQTFVKDRNIVLPIEKMKHKLPVSFGINVDFKVSNRIWLGTGAFYTQLKSEAKSLGSVDYDFEQKLEYIGVPVWLRYDILDNKKYSLYTGIGVAFEKCIEAKQILHVRNSSAYGGNRFEKKISKDGMQISTGINFGAQWNINDMLGLYFEPGISYYFENQKQPESYRTENPMNLTLKAGMRIKLVK